MPVAAPVPAAGRVRSIELPEAEPAVAVHAGAHDAIDVTYGELGRWAADHVLAVAGPVRGTYLVGPRDTPAAAAWRTEIGRPVVRVTG
ncbi:GyrI-like domain-containing protein [Streptomyces echinoruber]|uniref:GyrI-like domain-containing protein n=1 Tax=Streptomyces echinoruber TaxID=68898 RepID=UPI001E3D5F00|nr:GyrI-like domain-containing protein [Streptomyces echinoruber]